MPVCPYAHIYGHMGIWAYANNMAIWGILEKRIKNAAERCYPEFLREQVGELTATNQSVFLLRYGQCLKLLQEMKDNLMLDMYLAPHINTLFSMIRNRGLIQYFSPYSSADLHKMANSFNTTVTELENELMKLILDGSIQARHFGKDAEQKLI